MRNPRALVISAIIAGAWGCGQPTEEESDTPGAERVYEVVESPTYFEHIQPMMQRHCTGCHTEGAIAPFALDRPEQVSHVAEFLQHSMQTRLMPPWPPAPGCGDFQDPRIMLDEELETFERWIEQGKAVGDEDNQVVWQPDGGLPSDEPDLTLDMGVDYRPVPTSGQTDDYRCFVLDPGLEEDEFVNSLQTRPGNPLLAHHVIVYVVPETAFGEVETLLAEDERPGYDCFGSPRYAGAQMVAGWVPGTVRQPLKEGFGVRIPAGAKLVVQMHYTTVNDREGTDRTEVDLYFVDRQHFSQPKEIVLLQLAALDLFIAAGDPDATATATSPLIPTSLKVHGVVPHMHMLGRRIRADALTQDGELCMIDVPNWDFGWQGIYLYREPVHLQRPFRTRLTCEFDNSPGNQPAGQSPQDVTWGDESSDEMCLVMFIVERPDGL